jgi:putative tryptophan/tyrosine transport system substrate-binding protein
MNNKRRALIAVVFAVPLALQAQPARSTHYRIGFLGGGDTFRREFIDGMRDLGYEEGRHYAVLARDYRDNVERAAVAEALVALRPDVIVANVSSTAAVLKAKTRIIPIVMATAIDPVAEGLVQTLARPGGNVTGLTSLSHDLHAKLVELAHLLIPKARLLALAVNPDHALAKSHEEVASRAARRQGLDIAIVQVRNAGDLEALPEHLEKAQVDALIVSADAVLFGLRESLVKGALASGIPTVSVLSQFAEAGALASYGADVAASFRRAAQYVERILQGASPAELPVEQPTKFELVLNLRTARALRISIRQEVLLRADRVVE